MKIILNVIVILIALFLMVYGTFTADRIILFLGVGLTIIESLVLFLGRSKTDKSGGFLLTMQVVMDIRVMDIIEYGLIKGEIHIPSFIIDNLKEMISSENRLDQEKAKSAIEKIDDMVNAYKGKIIVPNLEKDSSKMVKYAKDHDLSIIGFFDSEIEEYASIREVEYIPFEKAILELRRRVYVGEELNIFLVKPGRDHGQAVGFLEDNSMVVVDNAHKYLSQKVRVKIKNVLKVNGKKQMVFADVIHVVEQHKK